MNAFIHLLVNLIIGLFLYALYLIPNGKTLALFILFSVLIDLDHILLSIFKHRTLSPKKWIHFMKEYRHRMEPQFYVFHSVEFNILLALASIFNPFLALVLLSNIIHITLDIIEHYKYHRNFECVKKWSVILLLV